MTSGASRAGPAVRRRYSGSAAPAGVPEVKRPRAGQHRGRLVRGPDLPLPRPRHPHLRAQPRRLQRRQLPADPAEPARGGQARRDDRAARPARVAARVLHDDKSAGGMAQRGIPAAHPQTGRQVAHIPAIRPRVHVPRGAARSERPHARASASTRWELPPSVSGSRQPPNPV